ncbi:MAG: hypothetical protein WCK80_04275, partial [bacterium]
NILVARNTSDVVSAITSANNAIADASNASILANAVAVGLQNTSALVVVQGSAINGLASNLSTTNLVVADVSSVAQSAMTLAGNSVQYDASLKGATINGDLSVTGKLLGSNNVVSIGTNAVQIVSGSSSNGGADRITTDGAAPAGADLHLGGTTISSAGVIGATPVNVQIDGNLIANNGVTVSAGTVVSMGSNKINNVASGVASTDAANVGQVNVAIGSKSGSVGTQNIATQVDSTGYATAAANSALTQSKTYTDSTVATINTNISSNITAINNVQNQVASIQSQTNQNTQDIYGLKQSLGSQQNQINNLNSGVAMAGALATARTAPITGGDGVYTSAGTAFYGGKSALSIGLVGVRGNSSINANVGYAPGANQNQTMISFGVSNKI